MLKLVIDQLVKEKKGEGELWATRFLNLEREKDKHKGVSYLDCERMISRPTYDPNLLPLGLRMVRSDSLLNLPRSIEEDNVHIVGSHHDKAKMKPTIPSYFPINTFTVGNWKRESSRQGDMTAKVYYGKKKLVWEFLDGPLKSKMEVSWSDITAIEAATNPNQPGFLRVELANPPFFFREIPPQPKMHCTWEPAGDFTGGQAKVCKRYEATFPPGALDKQYEKLLLNDMRLAQLSRKLTSTVIASNAPSYVVGSSSQNPIVISDQQLYEYDDMAVDNEPTFSGLSSSDQNLYVVPPSSWPPIFQHDTSETQYLMQNGNDFDWE
ncbi:uncharacterized protein LOC125206509 [Salvia hispanica]|uniref:uncharacterized protein LOC125206509 n=1 Tax=Salvia hispanica TaxID=49212 RepID=UPI00200960EB|nr:uncharacterized protein LOC125206509 [Salvia hispanica]